MEGESEGESEEESDGESDRESEGGSEGESEGETSEDAPLAQRANAAMDSSDDESPLLPKPLPLPKLMRAPKLRVPFNTVVHVPGECFPDDPTPSCGYWVGKTVKTKKGGFADVGMKIDGQEIFTWPRVAVFKWLA